MKRKRVLTASAVFLSFLAAGCGMKADLARAGAQVTHFHAQLDGEEYTTIYNEADPRFREASKLPDFVALLEAVHRKLGNVRDATQQNFFVNYNTSGSTVRVVYATRFTGGDAQEEFVWAKSGDRLQLLRYQINSNTLITR